MKTLHAEKPQILAAATALEAVSPLCTEDNSTCRSTLMVRVVASCTGKGCHLPFPLQTEDAAVWWLCAASLVLGRDHFLESEGKRVTFHFYYKELSSFKGK